MTDVTYNEGGKEYGISTFDRKNKWNKRHPTKTSTDIYPDNVNQDDVDITVIGAHLPDGSLYYNSVCAGKEHEVHRHSTGTGYEILMDGCRIETNVTNRYTYDKGGVTHTIQGNQDIKFGGHRRTNVEGGSDEEVKGNMTLFVAGSAASYVGENRIDHAAGGWQIAADKGSVTIGAHGTGQSISPVRISLGKDNTVYVTAAKDISIVAAGDMSLKCGGQMSFQSDGDFDVISKNVRVKTASAVMLEGLVIHLGAPSTYLSKSVAYVPTLRVSSSATPGAPASGSGANYIDIAPGENAATQLQKPVDSTPKG